MPATEGAHEPLPIIAGITMDGDALSPADMRGKGAMLDVEEAVRRWDGQGLSRRPGQLATASDGRLTVGGTGSLWGARRSRTRREQ